VAQEPDGLARRVDVVRALLHGGGHGSRGSVTPAGTVPTHE
jgi:hypothetical protein